MSTGDWLQFISIASGEKLEYSIEVNQKKGILWDQKQNDQKLI